MIGTAGNEMWATENGVRPVKERPAALSESRAIGKRFIFIRGCAHVELLLRGDSDLQRGAEASATTSECRSPGYGKTPEDLPLPTPLQDPTSYRLAQARTDSELHVG